MSKTNKGKIYYSMQAISVLPIILFGILVFISGTYSFTKAMTEEVFDHLDTSAHLCISQINSIYPGDYTLRSASLEEEKVYSLYKGEQDITNAYGLADHFKEDTGMDVTIFYENTRIITTVCDREGNRIIGTAAPEQIVADVMKQNQAQFYDNAHVNGELYFACYHPLTNADGTVVGMIFVGKPVSSIKPIINRSLTPMLLVGLISLIIAIIISYSYAKKILSILGRIKVFFQKTSTGNLNVKISTDILNRNDEFSEIATAALSMQRSLRSMVELDGLTNLLNRRTGEQKLKNTYLSSDDSQMPFCIVMADIDYFKSVNDTYGHHNGDVILQNVAGLLKKHTAHRGYAVRWGGEEFLLVFENHTLSETLACLEQLQEELRGFVHNVEGTELSVTMTFGVACDANLELDKLLELADDNLYKGKESGRNCIVS
ncbi:MAG: diguanylate cyclase [Lachnospiraceae bacterium]|nr:diguanylate cyclase [Lachnospiraceae bacterium]